VRVGLVELSHIMVIVHGDSFNPTGTGAIDGSRTRGTCRTDDCNGLSDRLTL